MNIDINNDGLDVPEGYFWHLVQKLVALSLVRGTVNNKVIFLLKV